MTSLYDTMAKYDLVKFTQGEGDTTCIAGALSIQMTRERYCTIYGQYLKRLSHLGRVARRLFPERVTAMHFMDLDAVFFNNHPDTTKEDVLKVCRVFDEEIESGVEGT